MSAIDELRGYNSYRLKNVMTEKHITNFRLRLLLSIGTIAYAISTSVCAVNLYKWVDENGDIRYSDRLPPGQVKYKREKLNEHGIVIETREAAKTPEEREAEKELRRIQEAEMAEQRRQIEEQNKHDRVLLLTFSSEEEMISVRDNRIEVINSVIRLIENSILTTEERLIKLENEADQNFVLQGKEVPGGLAQNIEFFTNKLKNRKEQLRLKLEERRKIDQQFDADLDRYRFLKSEAKQ